MNSQPKCKITVIKQTINQDLIDTYMTENLKTCGMCQMVKVGDEFQVFSEFQMPENFCHWAWADMRKDIVAVINGADYSWCKKKGMAISGCTDWFRPVFFKIEKL